MKLILKLVITAILFFVPNGYCSEPVLPKFTPIISITDTVTATIYNEGHLTASGVRLDQKHPEKHKIIAISRDLVGKYNFGDSVSIIGTGKYDGIYYIQDLMHGRWRKKIDILINPKDGINKFYNVVICKL